MIQSNFLSPEEYEDYLRERGIYAKGPFSVLWKQAWLTYKLYTRRFSNHSYTPTQEDVHNCNLATVLFTGVLPMANILWAYIQLEFIPNLILHTPRDKDIRCYSDEEIIQKVFNNNQMIFEASMKGAGMSRNQYNEAVSAYHSNDQERFLRVISDLPIESFSVPCEIIDAFVAFESIISGLGSDCAEATQRFTWLKIRDAVDDLLFSENVPDHNRFKTIASLLYGQIDKIATTDNRDIEAYQYIQWSLYLMFLIVDRMTQSLGNEEPVVVCLNEILRREEIGALHSQYLSLEFIDTASIKVASMIESFITQVSDTLQVDVNDLFEPIERNDKCPLVDEMEDDHLDLWYTRFEQFVDEYLIFERGKENEFLQRYRRNIIDLIRKTKSGTGLYALAMLFFPVKVKPGRKRANADLASKNIPLIGISWSAKDPVPVNLSEVVVILCKKFPRLVECKNIDEKSVEPARLRDYLIDQVKKGDSWIQYFIGDYWSPEMAKEFENKLNGVK